MEGSLKSWFALAILAIAVVSSRSEDEVTPFEQCPGEFVEQLRERVHVSPCGKTRCGLRKNHNITVTLKFNTKHEVQSLVNEVYGYIGGIKLPFVGVNGTNACVSVKRADTDAPAACPLSAGHEYVFSTVIPILKQFPTLPVRVHWGLNDGNRSLICTEIPAIIMP